MSESGGVHITKESCDCISFVNITSRVAELGYEEPTQMWCRVPRYSLLRGLTKLDFDVEVVKMAKLAVKSGYFYVFIEAIIKSVEIDQAEGNDGNARLEFDSKIDSKDVLGSTYDEEVNEIMRKRKSFHKEVRGGIVDEKEHNIRGDRTLV